MASGATTENLVLLLSLVPYVMDQGEVSVGQAAQQFDRSPEDIRRAVELIACAGVPGDSAAYLHTDLFDIDWELFESEDTIRFEQTIVIDQQPRLSIRELSALIAGLQYIAAHPSYGAREDVHLLLNKLRGGDQGAGANAMVVKAQVEESTLRTLSSALEQSRRVHFDYVNRLGESDARSVDPVGLEARDDNWYLRGWCHTREALRVFRLDRMSNVRVGEEGVEQHPELLESDSWSIFTPSESDLLVTVAFPAHALPVIAEYLDRSRPPEKRGDEMVAVIPFAHEASLVRFVAAHAGLVRVVGPEAAKQTVRYWAEVALEKLK